jgi:hypothetical protein
MPPVTKFKGTVVERSANGSGVVEFLNPTDSKHKLGVFSIDVVYTTEIDKLARVGHQVEGLAIPFGDNFKILRIEPK